MKMMMKCDIEQVPGASQIILLSQESQSNGQANNTDTCRLK